MSDQSVAVRNAMLNAIETTIGASPVLEVWTGAKPALVTDADVGTRVISATLPADWLADAASGAKALLGTWQDAAADNNGDLTANGYFRIKQGATTHLQGTAGGPGSGRQLTFDSAGFTQGQQVSVTAFTLNI